MERWFGEPQPGNRTVIRTWASRILLFHLVCLAWIFFRAQSWSASLAFLAGIADWRLPAQFLSALAFLALFAVPLLALDLGLEHRGEEYIFQKLPGFSRVLVGAALLLVILAFSANSNAAFIYFQF